MPATLLCAGSVTDLRKGLLRRKRRKEHEMMPNSLQPETLFDAGRFIGTVQEVGLTTLKLSLTAATPDNQQGVSVRVGQYVIVHGGSFAVIGQLIDMVAGPGNNSAPIGTVELSWVPSPNMPLLLSPHIHREPSVLIAAV